MSYDKFPGDGSPPKPPSAPSQLPARAAPAATPDGTLVPVDSLPGEKPTGTATPIKGTGTTPMPKPPGAPIDYAMPAPKKPFTIPPYAGCLVKMIAGFTILIAMGYFALVALNPKARRWAMQGAKDGTGGPTPFKALNQVLAIPAQAMGKTQDVVDANNARVGVLDGVVKEDEGKASVGGASRQPVIDPFAKAPTAKDGKAAAGTGSGTDSAVSRQTLLDLAEKAQADALASPAADRPDTGRIAEAPPPGPPELKLPGGIVITNNAEVGGPPATAAFMYWVAGLNISGVSQTSPPRFLLNNRLIYAGDEINKSQGIIFLRLDPVNKLLFFRDKNGAVISRSYL